MDRKINQSEVAKILGVSAAAVNKMVKQKRIPYKNEYVPKPVFDLDDVLKYKEERDHKIRERKKGKA